MTTPFAAFNVADETVISSIHRRHRAVEFTKVLAKLDAEVPAELTCTCCATTMAPTRPRPPAPGSILSIPASTCTAPRPAPSWISQVERWFGFLTDDLIRRGNHTSVQALEADIRNWVTAWNDNPKPFVWTKTAEQMLASLGRLITR